MSSLIESYLKQTGIDFSYDEKNDLEYKYYLQARDQKIEKTEGYLLNFLIGDTRGVLELSFETFSKALLKEFKKINEDEFNLLTNLASSLSGSIILKDNGIVINDDYQTIAGASNISISFESKMYDLRLKENKNELLEELARVAGMFVMTCFPYSASSLGEEEGNKTEILSNKYERSRKNRSQCISYHGVNCFICSFNFGSSYGEVAKGFIHVHHKKPVSEIGGSKAVDPIRDLVPLCPNCHAVAHLKNPPYSLDEVTEMLKGKVNG